MEAIARIGKETVVYAFGTAIKKMLGFFLLPVYTMVLSPAEYGIFDTLNIGVALIFILLNFGMDNAKNRYFYAVSDEKTKGKILFMILVLRLLTIIPVFVIIISAGWLSNHIIPAASHANLIIIAAISILSGFVYDEAGALFRLYREPWKYNLFIITRSIVLFGLGVFLVLKLKLGISGALLASILSEGIIGLIFIAIYSHRFQIGFDRKIFKAMVQYGLPYMASGITFWILSLSNRFILLYYEGFDAVGFYSIAQILSQPLDLINIAITLSFFPAIISFYEKENDLHKTATRLFVQKIIHLYMLIGILVIAGISFFSHELVLLFTSSQYMHSAELIPVILFGSFFFQLALLLMIVFDITRKTKWIFVIAIFNAGINIFLNFLCIRYFGILGAPIANLVTYFIYLICVGWFQNRVFTLPLSYLKLLIFVLYGFIIIFVIWWFKDLSILCNIFVKFLLLLLFGISLLLFRIVPVIELKGYLIDFFKKNKNE